MKKKIQPKRKSTHAAKSILRLPDLEVAKNAVINSLSCRDAQRGYRHAIDEFVEWYCSEPRLSFSKTVVIRYRMHLESRHLAPGTINLRLGAVRRLACEAADCGLLSADLAAGIRRVKGVKKLGVRLGNWLTPEQAKSLWQAPDVERLKGKRDRALLSILVACGLRRHEAAQLTVDHLQQREGHWAIVDLAGKGGHIRTIPVPDWVYNAANDWMQAAAIKTGRLFRKVSTADIHDKSMSREKTILLARIGERARRMMAKFPSSQFVPLGDDSCCSQNQTSICCLQLLRAVTED
jgi:site-specific recombinase XerD